MKEIKTLLREERINRAVENLKNNGFDVVVVEDIKMAEEITLQEIPIGSSISMGGSVTLNMTGLLKNLELKITFSLKDFYNLLGRIQ